MEVFNEIPETGSEILRFSNREYNYGSVVLLPNQLLVERCHWCPTMELPMLPEGHRWLDRICVPHAAEMLDDIVRRRLLMSDEPPVYMPRSITVNRSVA